MLEIRTASKKEYRDLELLFLSRYIPFSIQEYPMGKSFLIPPYYQEFVKKEIRMYRLENKDWPPPARPAKERSNVFHFSLVDLGVVLGLAYFHWMTFRSSSRIDWLTHGKLSAEKVLSGEWCRTVTALTLHVDDPHFLSNFFGLILFVSGVNHFVGGGASWFLVLLSGALGNYLNALFYQTAHQAIGASTAVFGAVGIVGTLGVKRYFREKHSRTRFFVPVIGSLGIFAMLGTSLETDVMAHLFGFLSGLGIGLAIMPLIDAKPVKNPFTQFAFFVAFVGIVYYCWKVQLAI
ncbi:MAG: rhomboid family intramembrane serine protease [Proteobacteria bacterium]|nr:rhomboid family intramembrane serine protease [Pseudomonadota bacterium]